MAVAAFVDFCVSRGLNQPPEKIVKNLCTFLCQDVEQTPTFAFTRKYTRGIMSFKTPQATEKSTGKEDPPPSPEAAAKARLSRRGASLAFVQLSDKFGVRVLFLTANPSSITMAVTGTVGCLGKPCPPEEVCAAIDFAIEGCGLA